MRAKPVTGRQGGRNQLAAAALVAALSPVWLPPLVLGVLTALGEPSAWSWLPLGIVVTALPGGLLALIFGLAAAKRTPRSGERRTGRRLAKVAVVAGGLLIIALLMLLVLFLVSGPIASGP